MFKSNTLLALSAALALSAHPAISGDLNHPETGLKKAVAPQQPPPFFLYQFNDLSYFYTFKDATPYLSINAKQTLEFRHFDAWAYGTNFVLIDFTKADSRDPIAPYFTPGAGPGAPNVWSIWRSTLGLNELTNTKMFSYGPLKNLSLAIGADLGTEANYESSLTENLYGGVQADFNLPYHGFFLIDFFALKGWNHNAFLDNGSPLNPANNVCILPGCVPGHVPPFGVPYGIPGFVTTPGGQVQWPVTWAVQTRYEVPFGFIPEAHLSWEGYSVINGWNGYGSPELAAAAAAGDIWAQSNKLTTEYRVENKLVWDVGSYIGLRPKQFSVFASYMFWQNLYGNNAWFNNPNGARNPFNQTDTLKLGARMTF